MKRCKGQRGFTLIELLVVIAIIALLSSVILATLSTARAKGRYARAFSDMRQIQNAVEIAVSDTGSYPADVSGGTAPLGIVPAAIAAWPTPPCPGWNYDYENWTNPYGGIPVGGNVVRVTLRNASSVAIGYLCLYTNYQCKLGGEPVGLVDMRDVTTKQITCQE